MKMRVLFSHSWVRLETDYEGIKRIYAINTAKLLRLENEKKTKNEADRDVNAGADARNVNNANILPR